MDYYEIGARIRAQRQRKKITQEQLAEMAEISLPHISHIETGSTIPSMKTFVLIANALEVSSDVLLSGEVDGAIPTLTGELADAVRDCSPQELRVITDTTKALKESLRKRTY